MENRGDREMGICEMQQRLWVANASYLDARTDYDEPSRSRSSRRPPAAGDVGHRPARKPTEPHGIGWVYCPVLSRLLGVKEAQAADVRRPTCIRSRRTP